MTPYIPPPPSHTTLLLSALASPQTASTLDERGWDLLVRTARAAGLLGSLAKAIETVAEHLPVPELPARHLHAASVEARYLRQMTLYEMDCVATAVASLGTPLILLKGAAYVAQELPIAAGRFPRDLDLLVADDRLERVEAALQFKGWQYDETLTDYDHHYYRAWTHELPPMRLAGHVFEVDLHHSILPPIGRLKPDAARLIADSIAIPGSPFRVLRPADQVLHAAAHLFQDSDCVGKLRDLVDLDGLIRHFSAKGGEDFWQRLRESAEVHGLVRPLWYVLAFCRAWLDTPIPGPVWDAMRANRPPAPARALMTALASRVLSPVHPDAEVGLAGRMAASALEFRSVWLRMPPWTLAYHGANKLVRAMRSSTDPRTTG